MLAEPGRSELQGIGEHHRLGEAELDRLALLVARLEHHEHVPSSPRATESALEVHVADSLSALEVGVFGDRRAPLSLVDLGAGAGFPGLPLAIALQASHVSLVESQERKCRFIEDMCATLRIENASVICARIEEWGSGMGRHDVAVARALGPPAIVLEYAAPLLRQGGTLIDWRGRRDPELERDALAVAAVLGLELTEIRRVEPYAGVHSHHLHIYVKVRDTPSRFPRRAGMARKRPLRATDRLEGVRP